MPFQHESRIELEGIGLGFVCTKTRMTAEAGKSPDEFLEDLADVIKELLPSLPEIRGKNWGREVEIDPALIGTK